MRICLGILAIGMLAGTARAATVAEALTALAGEWQGVEVSPIGHAPGAFHLSLTPAAPGGAVLGKARIGDDGEGLLPVQDFEVVQSGGQCFATTAADGSADGAFAVEHSPFGGLRFHRLARVASLPEGQVAVQAEEIVLGKAAADGTRRLKITRGERLCRDGAGATSVCGAAESRMYTVKR